MIADTRALVARARDRVFESRQAAIKTCISSDDTLTRQMKRNFERAKRRHLKEIKSYIKERQKADKRIERALKREKARKEREEAKRKRQEADDDDENLSDASLSSSGSESSVRNNKKNIWKDIEQLEGIFSLV